MSHTLHNSHRFKAVILSNRILLQRIVFIFSYKLNIFSIERHKSCDLMFFCQQTKKTNFRELKNKSFFNFVITFDFLWFSRNAMFFDLLDDNLNNFLFLINLNLFCLQSSQNAKLLFTVKLD